MTTARWDNERIVQSLYDAGVSKSDAIVALSRGGGVPRADATRIVHHSKAYEARKSVDAAWNNSLLDCLEDDEFIASLESEFNGSPESGPSAKERSEENPGDPVDPARDPVDPVREQ